MRAHIGRIPVYAIWIVLAFFGTHRPAFVRDYFDLSKRSPAVDPLVKAPADVRQWWIARLRRFQWSPTSPIGVRTVFYLKAGSGLYTRDPAAAASPRWQQTPHPPDDAALAIVFRDQQFRVQWDSRQGRLEQLIQWDPMTLQGTWQPATQHFTTPGGTFRWGEWPLHLSHHPPYGRVLIFRSMRERPLPIARFDLFPYNPEMRFRARLIPGPSHRTAWIETSRGLQTPMPEVGWLEFTYRGKTYRLRAFIEEGNDPSVLFILFRDATTGKTTYPVGRYVEAVRQPDGSYILDLNKAYVPLCAYADAYNCPIPPKENTLPFAVSAGERFMGH